MVDLFKTETVNSDILIDETMSIVTADENFVDAQFFKNRIN